MSWIIWWIISILFGLMALNSLVQTKILSDKLENDRINNAYVSYRLDYNKKFINFIDNQTKVSYETETLFDLNSDSNVNKDGLVFEFEYSPTQNWYIFIPLKWDTWKYIYNKDDTKLEYIDNTFLSVSKGALGSYYYSGNNNTGYVYDSIDNTQLCYFDSSTNTCN